VGGGEVTAVYFIPDDFTPRPCLIVEYPDLDVDTDERRTVKDHGDDPSILVECPEAWLSAGTGVVVHVKRGTPGAKRFRDGWQVSHSVTGARMLGPLGRASTAFAFAREMDAICDWGDVESINAATPAIQILRAAYDRADIVAEETGGEVLAAGAVLP